jgi:hypothetical protein
MTGNEEVKVGDKVRYSDFQFGCLDGSKLVELKMFVFGTYAVLEFGGEEYVVPFRKIKPFAEGEQPNE